MLRPVISVLFTTGISSITASGGIFAFLSNQSQDWCNQMEMNIRVTDFTVVVNALSFLFGVVDGHPVNLHRHLWVHDGAGFFRVDFRELLCRDYLSRQI